MYNDFTKGRGLFEVKISTKGRYALRLMIDLAQHDTGENIPVRAIAQRQGISEKYLEQIITVLIRAGYVKSTRGHTGGYRLAFPPEHYTAGMVLRLTEGDLAPVACMKDPENPCERNIICPTMYLWCKLAEAIDSVVDSITLQDLLDNIPVNNGITDSESPLELQCAFPHPE